MTLVPLAQANDRARFGGKAAHLSADLTSGLPVPDGFALDVDVVTAVAARSLSLSDELPDGLWAVRSSAVDEDGERASFAGLHESVIGVRSIDVDDAVARVHASARCEAALAYRKRLGLSAEPRMAVVVQRVVHARVSAVVFTKNPVTGAAELFLEAAWGFGEAVVSGLVVPDRFRLSYAGEVLERTLGDKDIELVHEGGALVEQSVSRARALASCLDEDDLSRIAALAGRVRERDAGEHDLEVALDGSDLHLLQRRGITR